MPKASLSGTRRVKMNDAGGTFALYRREYVRLHDPEVWESSAEFVPVGDATPVPPLLVRGDRYDLGDNSSLKDYLHAAGIQRDAAQQHAADLIRGLSPSIAQNEISLTPTSLACKVALHEDYNFETFAPAAQRVKLVWEPVGGRQQRVDMDVARRSLFKATLNLPDGDYLYGYVVDGCCRPGARHAQHLMLRRDGVFSRLRLTRQSHAVMVCNRGEKERVLSVEADASWIDVKPELRLPPQEKLLHTFHFKPQKMCPGHNEGRVSVVWHQRESRIVVAEAKIQAIGELNGAIPEVRCSPENLGKMVYGASTVRVQVEVAKRGVGELRGRVLLSHTNEVAQFRLPADSDDSPFKHSFLIDSAKLPYRDEGTLKVTVATNCYIATRRLIVLELPYVLLYFKKSPIALTFGQVRPGEVRTMTLEAARSDGRSGNVEVCIPKTVSNHLTFVQIRPNLYTVRFDAQGLRPGTVIREEITLREHISGLRDKIALYAEVRT